MIRPQPYYFEDMVFQLELNLQNIRRDLVRLLDEYGLSDCFNCHHLKCTCHAGSYKSTDISITSSYELLIDAFHEFYRAPPAQELPTPDWSPKKLAEDPEVSIQTWVRASLPKHQLDQQTFPLPVTCLDEINYSWPPFPKSVWNQDRQVTEIEIAKTAECEKENAITVDAFFRYFKNVAKKATCSF